MAENERARPRKGADSELITGQGSSSGPSYEELDRRAALALRVAWLRVHGHRMFSLDSTGQTSAQLWDFADLLELLEAEGRWAA